MLVYKKPNYDQVGFLNQKYLESLKEFEHTNYHKTNKKR